MNKFDLAENCSSLASLVKMSGRTPENKLKEISSLTRLERLPIPFTQRPRQAIALKIKFTKIF